MTQKLSSNHEPDIAVPDDKACHVAMPRILVIENEAECPPGKLLSAAESARVQIKLIRPYLGESIPKKLSPHYIGLIVLGGGMGPMVDDDYPWLTNLRTLLKEAVASDFPTLGICLGAELLSAAISSGVQRLNTPELGRCRVTKTAAAEKDPIFSVLPADFDVWQWHQEYIPDLPANSVLLTTNSDCPVQAFRTGENVYAVQFHPERTAEIALDWAASSSLNPGREPESFAAEVDSRLASAASVLDGFLRFAQEKCAG